MTVTDANTPYRLMRSEALDASLELIPESFNLSNVMISVDLREESSFRCAIYPLPSGPGREGLIPSI